MAFRIDGFDILFKEISSVFSHYRDGFALLGGYYALAWTFYGSQKLVKAFRVHVVSKFSEVNLVWKFGSWAVVTGGSQGIGKAYAMELAARKVNIILIDKDIRNLDSTAEQIEKMFNVKVQKIHTNFNYGPSVYKQIAEDIAGKEIGILVNNVGVMYDYPQMFLDVQETRLWQLINVNVTAATILTHMVLPQMVERKRGAIVNVSAGSCSVPTPQITVYSATTAYLDYFSRALQYEYQQQGIIVQSLVPFYVNTRMTRYMASKNDKKAGGFFPSADVYARHAVNTLCYSSRTTGYFPHTVQLWLLNIIPEGLWLWAASRLNSAIRRRAKQSPRRRHESALRNSASYNSFSESDSGGNGPGDHVTVT